MRATKMPDADSKARIRWRAYSLWEQRAGPEDRADEHWSRAEAEVTGLNTSGTAPPGTPGAGLPGVPGHRAHRP